MHDHIGTLLHKIGDKEGRLHSGICEAKQQKCVNNIIKKKKKKRYIISNEAYTFKIKEHQSIR